MSTQRKTAGLGSKAVFQKNSKQANSSGNLPRFQGTANPRHLRTISALLQRPISRKELDSRAGAANGPALVADLRDLNLEIPCERIRFIDRDGVLCRPGVYSFTKADKRKVRQWLQGVRC